MARQKRRHRLPRSRVLSLSSLVASSARLATTTNRRCPVRIMLVLTATGVVGECGPQEYKATPVLQILLDPGWANGLKHL